MYAKYFTKRYINMNMHLFKTSIHYYFDKSSQEVFNPHIRLQNDAKKKEIPSAKQIFVDMALIGPLEAKILTIIMKILVQSERHDPP